METAIKTTTKFNCLCGFGTDDAKAFNGHFLALAKKEKGLHKSIKEKSHGLSFIPFKKPAVETPVETPKTPLQKLQDELAAMNQRATDLATAIEQEAENERKRHEDEAKKKVIAEAETILEKSTVEWKKPRMAKKTGIRNCIVISDNDWYEMKVDLKDMETADCEWGYYGTKFPVLIEKDGQLMPYIYQDTIGESATRLFKAANPEGFKEVFRHRNGMMEKIKVGLMVALVCGLFLLIYIMATQKPSAPVDANTVMVLLGVI